MRYAFIAASKDSWTPIWFRSERPISTEGGYTTAVGRNGTRSGSELLMHNHKIGRRTKILGAFMLAASFGLSSVCHAFSTEVSGKAHVIDGDTLDVAGQRVRLHGIDAFEKHQQCQISGIAWPCGASAVTAMVAAINGQDVSCVGNSHDRYMRLIGVCRVHGVDLGKIMVHDGWALAYREYSMDYVSDEEQARAGGYGAWSGQFIEPWIWRKTH